MRPISRVLAVCIPLVVITGCSSSGGTTPTPQSSTSSGTTSTSPTPAPVLQGQGYTISLPKGWVDATATAKQNNQAADIAIAEQTSPGTFRTNFNVVNPTPISANVTKTQVLAEAGRELKGVTHAKVTTFAGPAFDGTSSNGQSSDTTRSGLHFTLIQYIVIRQGKVYGTTLTFESKRAKDARKNLAEIVSSWAWTN